MVCMNSGYEQSRYFFYWDSKLYPQHYIISMPVRSQITDLLVTNKGTNRYTRGHLHRSKFVILQDLIMWVCIVISLYNVK